MAITYLIKINGVKLPKIKSYKVARNKLWSDADRNMAGELRSTFIGIFPKISLEFAHTTGTEMETIADLLDVPSFTVSYYDRASGGYKSGTYYAGDYEMSNFDTEKELYLPFQVSLIPFEKE